MKLLNISFEINIDALYNQTFNLKKKKNVSTQVQTFKKGKSYFSYRYNMKSCISIK
jgi:hypothetical protein